MNNELELICEAKAYLKCFLEKHQTKSTKSLKPLIHYCTDLHDLFDFFNRNIYWYNTVEGGLYYYFLNLRWVIALSYFCHEHSKDYDNLCLEQLNRYYKFSNENASGVYFGSFNYTIEEYRRLYRYYAHKMKKIKEIFGS